MSNGKRFSMDEDDELVITIRLREREKEDEDGGDGVPPGPTATPFLLIAYGQQDNGQRPAPASQALANSGVRATIKNPRSPHHWNDFTVQLSCALTNLGAVACATGVAEFFVGAEFGIWNPPHATLTPAQVKADAKLVGRTAFSAPPGRTTILQCPTLWTPGSASDAEKGVLVQVSDIFTDPLTMPFDGIDDRHVGRNDGVMDPLVRAVTVSGVFSPVRKIDTYAVSVTFADAVTGAQYTAAPDKDGRYSILLPNPASYIVSLTTAVAGIGKQGTGVIGMLNLNFSGAGGSETFNVEW